MTPIRLVGIATVRNEDDLLGESLRHAARIFDLILVVDCGSTDATVARVREVEAEHPHVVLIGELAEGHAASVRRHVFARFARHLPPRSWWGIADADEFIELGARDKVERAHREGADHVRFEMAQFFITRGEVAAGRAGPEDRHRPIAERRRAYVMSEEGPRFFRNLPWMRWQADTAMPTRFARAGSQRVVIRHYQYRDLDQMRVRLDTRRRAAMPPEHRVTHRHWIADLETLVLDDAHPRLRWDEPGKPLVPDASLSQHWVALWPGSAFVYARAMVEALRPQRPATLFEGLDVPAVLARMRPADRS